MLLANMENRVEPYIYTNLIVELWNKEVKRKNFDKQEALRSIAGKYNKVQYWKIQVFEVAGIIREIEKQQNEEAIEVDYTS